MLHCCKLCPLAQYTPPTPTRQNSFVASATAVCIGHYTRDPCMQRQQYTVNKKAQLSLTNPRYAVEIRVMDHSRASKVTPFDCFHMVSYYRPIVTLCLKCTIFEIRRHIGRQSPKKLLSLSFCTFLGVTPCEFFDESYLARKRNHGAIRWRAFHDPAFVLLDTIPRL